MVSVKNRKLVLPSKLENIRLVEKLVDEVCEQFEVKEDMYGHILVAITEAVSNSVLHGNQSNPKTNIEVTFKIRNDILYFIIKDQGAGFDHTKLPDPTTPDNIEKPAGRGVFLMKHLCDNIAFENNGSKVILGFRLA